MTSYRLESGGAINRGQALNFTFDGRTYRGSRAIRLPRPCWPTIRC